ncbi:hypothetical protein [Gordoniibacillus kamchatkensis]|uniref:hypothetical protein n=1 Tax=Gordoniibacillus kamchatkensis TaxID=1590651 RepID=UPI000695BDAB|nr:hypothetical protein [Paenibacillus sp. VKM B-2647]
MSKRFLIWLPFNLLYPHLFELLLLMRGWRSFREHRRLFYRVTFYYVLLNASLFFVHVAVVTKYVPNPALAYPVHVAVSMVSSLIFWRAALPLFVRERGRVFLERKRTGTIETVVTVTLVLLGTVALAGYAALQIKISGDINQAIAAHDGAVIQSEAVTPGESPFGQSGGNVVFRVTYAKAGREYVAWYRPEESTNETYDNATGDGREKWVFEER